MSLIAKDRRESSKARGKKYEEKTLDLAEQENWIAIKQTDNEDMFRKIDLWIMFDSLDHVPVQIKSPSVKDRAHIMTCEFKDVNGNDGWLFAGPEYLFKWIDQKICLLLKISQMVSILDKRGKVIEMNAPQIGRSRDFPLGTVYRRHGREDSLIDVRIDFWKENGIGNVFQLRD